MTLPLCGQTSNAISSITVIRIVFQPVSELCFRVIEKAILVNLLISRMVAIFNFKDTLSLLNCIK
jgi:hypothetical protein